MTQPRREPPPEARGPGVETASGGIAYGGTDRATVVVEPARPAWERDADMEAARERARCDRCMDLPDDLVLAAARAIRAAKEGRLT
jgi:hypothetical protein